MSIVCGTDFSETAARAVRAAGHIAMRAKTQLVLVHAVEPRTAKLRDEHGVTLADSGRAHLERDAMWLRDMGVDVVTRLEAGTPDEAITRVASSVDATLCVVAALGQRQPGKWHIGGHADRLAHAAHRPTLVVRDAEPFVEWGRDGRKLRVVLGVDKTHTCEAAVRWVNALGALGPLDVVAVHLYWPVEEYRRLGLSGVRGYAPPDPEVVQTNEREIREWMSRVADVPGARLRIEPHFGRMGDGLLEIAREERAEVVVVGSHGKDALERAREGSTSRQLLHTADLTVACIPAELGPRAVLGSLRSFLVPTDFSTAGNAAVALAYAAVATGGTVHLVHWVRRDLPGYIDPHDIFEAPPAEHAEESRAIRAKLRELIPHEVSKGIRTHVHVVQSLDAADAICQAAERLGADAICLGTHGRTGLLKVLLGSVAEQVLHRTSRPVLLAKAPSA